MLSNSAVGLISSAANDENAITARNAVPPAWPTVAYSSETAPNSKASIGYASIVFLYGPRLLGFGIAASALSEIGYPYQLLPLR